MAPDTIIEHTCSMATLSCKYLWSWYIHVELANLKPLQSLLLSDTDVALLKRNRTKAVVKEVKTLGWINSQEGGHVLVVW